MNGAGTASAGERMGSSGPEGRKHHVNIEVAGRCNCLDREHLT